MKLSYISRFSSHVTAFVVYCFSNTSWPLLVLLVLLLSHFKQKLVRWNKKDTRMDIIRKLYYRHSEKGYSTDSTGHVPIIITMSTRLLKKFHFR